MTAGASVLACGRFDHLGHECDALTRVASTTREGRKAWPPSHWGGGLITVRREAMLRDQKRPRSMGQRAQKRLRHFCRVWHNSSSFALQLLRQAQDEGVAGSALRLLRQAQDEGVEMKGWNGTQPARSTYHIHARRRARSVCTKTNKPFDGARC